MIPVNICRKALPDKEVLANDEYEKPLKMGWNSFEVGIFGWRVTTTPLLSTIPPADYFKQFSQFPQIPISSILFTQKSNFRAQMCWLWCDLKRGTRSSSILGQMTNLGQSTGNRFKIQDSRLNKYWFDLAGIVRSPDRNSKSSTTDSSTSSFFFLVAFLVKIGNYLFDERYDHQRYNRRRAHLNFEEFLMNFVEFHGDFPFVWM